jgi:hypothetical protein
MPSVAPDTGAGASDVLLERASLLEELNGVLAATATGGRVVLVVGETGIGKSALVKWFTERQSAHAQFLLGAYDPLLTPHALGPLHDIARQTGGRLAELLVSGAPSGPLLRRARQRPGAGPPVARCRAPWCVDAGWLLGDRRPDGTVLAGPLVREEGILYATLDLDAARARKRLFDPVATTTVRTCSAWSSMTAPSHVAQSRAQLAD